MATEPESNKLPLIPTLTQAHGGDIGAHARGGGVSLLSPNRFLARGCESYGMHSSRSTLRACSVRPLPPTVVHRAGSRPPGRGKEGRRLPSPAVAALSPLGVEILVLPQGEKRSAR